MKYKKVIQRTASSKVKILLQRKMKDNSSTKEENNILRTQVRKLQQEIAKIRKTLDEQSAKEILRAGEEKYKMIAHSSMDIIFMIDKAGKILFINDSLGNTLGYTAEELIGKSFTRFVPRKELEKYRSQLKNIFLRKEVKHFETQIDHKDGTTVDVEINGKLIKYNRNNVGLGTIRDITARKKSEQKIVEVQLMLHRIINLLPVRVFWKDKDLKYLGCNEVFAKDAGKKNPKELFGKDDTTLVWKEQAGSYQTDDRIIIDSGIPKLNFEEPQTTPDGKKIWLSTSKVPLTDFDGNTIGVLGTYEDITERKHAEQALKDSESKFHELYSLMRLMSDTMPDLIWAKDLDNKYIFANKAMCDKLLGAVDTTEPVGKTDLFFALRERRSHPEDPQWHTFGELCRDSDEVVVQEMKEMQFDEYGNVKGKFLFLDVHKAPLFRNDGKLIGVVGSARDITDRKRAEETLRTSEEHQRFILQSMPVAMYSSPVDPTIDTNWISGDVKRVTGFDVEEYLSGPDFWRKRIHPDDAETVFETYKTIKLNDEIILEYRWKCKDGQYHWFQDRTILKEKENHREYLGVITDVTERKKSENLLRQSEISYRGLFNSVSDAIYFLNAKGQFIDVNPGALQMYGYEYDELVGKTPEFVNAPGKNDMLAVVQALKKAMDGEPQQFEFWGLRKNGEVFLKDVHLNKGMYFGEDVIIALAQDISERKKNEKKIRENEERYRTIVENLHQAYFEADGRAMFTYFNPELCIISGYSELELTGTSSLRLVAEEHRVRVTDSYFRWKKEKNTKAIIEFLTQKKNGEKIWVEQITHFEFDEYGRFIKGANIIKDIHERKMAEEALVTEKNLLMTLINTIPDRVYVKDKESRFLLNNTAHLHALGAHSQSEAIGKTDHDFRKREFADQYLTDDRSVILSDIPINNKEELTILPSGELGTVLVNKVPLHNSKGDVIGLVGVSRDITERKRLEEGIQQSEIFFRSVWEHTSSGMRLTDENGTIITVNKSFCEMVGKTEKELVGSSLAVIYMPESHTRIAQKHKERFSNRSVPLSTEQELLLWNGKKVWFKVLNSFIEFGSAKNLLLGIFSDITEQKKSEQIIQDLQRRESIGLLAGGIAHDFNNLLASMMGNLSLAKMRIVPDHPAVKNLDRTMVAVERAATLTKQMLAYSGKGRFQSIAIDLVKVVKEHIELFEASLPKNVSIVTHLSPNPVYVKGDPGQIEQIIMNLIINGGEAIGEKNGVVDISVFTMMMSDEALEPFGKLNNRKMISGEYALFQVLDNGIGMKEEMIAKIFDPFFTTKFVGRGLGLSAVLGIIRGHGGGITVHSQENVGTTFQVIMPLLKTGIEESKSHHSDNDEIPHAPTILVIDDEQYIIDMTDDIFESNKYHHYSAVDPVKGISIFKEHWHSIDLVILDYAMPKMNGKEVLIELLEINPTIKVIMSSGYSEEELIYLMGDIKPNAFIQKPHRPEKLLSLISTVLNLSKV